MMSEDRPSVRLIGLALLDFDTVAEAAADCGFSEDWLDGQWTRETWRTIADMHSRRLPIDPPFVSEHAASLGFNISTEHLDRAERAAPTQRMGADALLGIIRRDYVERRVIEQSSILAEPGSDPIKTACEVAHELLKVAGTEGAEDMDGAAERVCQMWRDAHEGHIAGLPMPWETVFNRTGGIDPGQVGLFVGHGGSGKSAALLQWAKHASERGWPVLVFPFEDGVEGAVRRLAGMYADVNVFKLRIGRGRDEEVARASEAAMGLSRRDIHLSGKRGGLTDIFSVAQHHVVHKGVKAIYLDAFKDIRGTHDLRGENETMAGIVEMAERLRVPIVVSHHVRKQSTAIKGQDRLAAHISKDDLRGSARLWDDARFVMALQQYPTEATDAFGNMEFEYFIHVLKTNHGITGINQPVERDKTLQFREIERRV